MYMSEARAKHDWKYIQSLERTDKDQYNELKKQMTKDAYAVKYDSEIHYPCVMHYDPQLYLRQKSAHRLGQRKSKPNGIVFHYYRR